MEGMYGLQFNNKFLWTTNQCETPMPNGMIFSEIKNLVQTYFSRINKTIWFTGSWNKNHPSTLTSPYLLDGRDAWDWCVLAKYQHPHSTLATSLATQPGDLPSFRFSKWGLCWYLTLFMTFYNLSDMLLFFLWSWHKKMSALFCNPTFPMFGIYLPNIWFHVTAQIWVNIPSIVWVTEISWQNLTWFSVLENSPDFMGKRRSYLI